MRYVLAVDQGTTSTRCLAYDLQAGGAIVASHQVEFENITPSPGWVEQDPIVVYRTVDECLNAVHTQLTQRNVPASDIAAIGITNQRETTVVWSRSTGKPLYNAIVWMDGRTKGVVDALISEHGGKRDALRPLCGLPFSTYFSGPKLRWMIENDERVRSAVRAGDALFGTIDSWLVYNLTGGRVHATDVTNASRSMLLNLETLAWDERLCAAFGVPRSMLPDVRATADSYGSVAEGALAGVPIAACMGDQQAALLGQLCVSPGATKATFGTGCFMLMHTGTHVPRSTHGLLSTVAFQARGERATFALEGSVAIAGEGVRWLRDNLGIIKSAAESGVLASSVPDSGGVTFVPAFSGLLAPHWRPDARGVIVGLTQYTTKAHIARALLEAVCMQTLDVLDAMVADSHEQPSRLRVDGGMSASDFVLQLLADTVNVPVVRPTGSVEATAQGAAIAAALGCGVWRSLDDAQRTFTCATRDFVALESDESRAQRTARWRDAISRSFNLA